MLTASPLAVTYGRIAVFNKINENRLGSSLINLASGKKIRKPEDNVTDYFHAQRLSNQTQDNTRIRRNVSEASALLKVASDAGEIVFNSVTRMKDITTIYYNDSTDDKEKAALKSEFSALQEQVEKVVTGTTYDGDRLIRESEASPIKSVIIDNKNRSTINIAFTSNQIADVSGLTLGVNQQDELSAVEGQLKSSGSYLGRVSALTKGLDAQYSILSTNVNVSSATGESITKTDSGREMFTAMNRSIQHQSSLAMMAQANIARGTIIRLFN